MTARALLRVRVRFRNCRVTLRRSTAETERVIGTVGAVTAEPGAAHASEFRDITSIIGKNRFRASHFIFQTISNRNSNKNKTFPISFLSTKILFSLQISIDSLFLILNLESNPIKVSRENGKIARSRIF